MYTEQTQRVDIYQQDDNIGISIFQPIEDESKFKIGDVLQETIAKFNDWKTLYQIEIGYDPVETLGECAEYIMQKVIVDYLDQKTNFEDVHRNHAVEEWNIYYKFVITRKNAGRLIGLILKKYGINLTSDEKNQVTSVIKQEIDFIQI